MNIRSMPLPVAIGMALLALCALCFAANRALRRSAATGDMRALAAEVSGAHSKDAPALPPGINPSRGTILWKRSAKG